MSAWLCWSQVFSPYTPLIFCHTSLRAQGHAACLFSMCVVNTRGAAFRGLFAIPSISNAERRMETCFRLTWPRLTSPDSTGPRVNPGTADVIEADQENLIFTEAPKASAACEAQLLSDQSLSPRQLPESSPELSRH